MLMFLFLELFCFISVQFEIHKLNTHRAKSTPRSKWAIGAISEQTINSFYVDNVSVLFFQFRSLNIELCMMLSRG